MDYTVGGDASKDLCSAQSWRCGAIEIIVRHSVADTECVVAYRCNTAWDAYGR